MKHGVYVQVRQPSARHKEVGNNVKTTGALGLGKMVVGRLNEAAITIATSDKAAALSAKTKCL